jgi:ATP-dependent DNA helicase RecQ
MSAADQHLRRVLAAMAGPAAEPRADQLAAVSALVEDHARVLVVQATGWGKSAVYWAATSARRAAGFGPTLVVSPLLALMRDQVSAATAAGLVAATVNSTNHDDWDAIFADASAGRLDVLLVSPERLANPRFAELLPTLISSAGLIVIDEAHCISDWGFDFRPDYQRLARILVSVGPNTPVLATTATANERVTADVAGQLGRDTVTFRGSLARSSLSLAVVPGLGAVERYAWVADALTTTIGSGIIYTLTVAECERLAAFLASSDIGVAAYHGGLDSAEREAIEDRLRRNDLKAVVATSALGMGYDKPDLAFCIHVGSPSSPVAYYQQVGRAGRALDDAVAVLLPAETDERIWDFFATAGVPDPARVEQILSALTDESMSLVGLESATTIRRGRLEGLLKILSVEGVVTRNGTQWSRTDQPWVYDHERWDALAAVRAREADLMRSFAAGAGCLMRFLQTALDDPDPSDCGRCSVCTCTLPPPGAKPSAEQVLRAQSFVRGLDVVIEPRKLWPGGVAKKGKIVGCTDGRALAFADDPGWADELRAMFKGSDGPAPQSVLDGLVAVLGRWRRTWGERPVAVVPCPSLGFPRLIRSVCDHLATVGKLEVIDALGLSGATVGPDAASGARVASLLAGMALRPEVVLPSGPVLLVDAIYRSGWTATVAASLLRQAGATAVLPLAIHRVP